MIKHVCKFCGAELESTDEAAGRTEACTCGGMNRVPGAGRYVSTSATWRTSVAVILGITSLVLWPLPPAAIAVSALGVVLVWRESRTSRSLGLFVAAILCAVGLTLGAVRLATAA